MSNLKGVHADPFTKDDIRIVIESWATMTAKELGDKLNRPETSIAYLAHAIRKAGYDLPRKTKHGGLKAKVAEVLAELGLKPNV